MASTFELLMEKAVSGKLSTALIDKAIAARKIGEPQAVALRATMESIVVEAPTPNVVNLDAGLPTDAKSIDRRNNGVRVVLDADHALLIVAASGVTKKGTAYNPRDAYVVPLMRSGNGWTRESTRLSATRLLTIVANKALSDKVSKAHDMVSAAWGGFAPAPRIAAEVSDEVETL
jgi:hypothetical protein